MAIVLHKPNPWIDGIFESNNVDLKIFNQVLTNLQMQKANGSFLAIVSLEDLRAIIKDKNLNTEKGILEYLKENFQKNIIRWTFDKKIYQVGLLTKVVYDKENKQYEITVDDDLVNFALNYKELKTGYTPINLDLTHNTKSFYSQRLYGMFRQWSGSCNEKTFKISELREKLLLQNKYNVYSDFKKRVIQPAIDEINENMNMKVDYKANKLGKAFQSITFYIEDFEPRQYDYSKENIVEAEIIKEVAVTRTKCKGDSIASEELKKIGVKIADSTLNRLSKKYGEKNLYIAINILCNKVKNEKVSAPVKYLTGILENINSKKKEETKQLKFNNFEARDYDFDKLEKQLLGWED